MTNPAEPRPAWRHGPVGVVGLGLIGGSLGLDLQTAGAEVRALVRREATATRARDRGLASVVSTDPWVLAGCDLVVLALPLDQLLAPPPDLLQALPPEAVLTDVGSVKGPLLPVWSAALRRLGGERQARRFVPSHPMAGTAEAGVEAGVCDLFVARPWVVTPADDTDPEALALVADLAATLGARWVCCEARAHDAAVALISHLPVLVSAALLQTADRSSAGEGQPALSPSSQSQSSFMSSLPSLVRTLASSGFADTTRVGGGNPELGTLMARGNREAVLQALAGYRHSLDQLEQLVRREDWAELQQLLTDCRDLRPQFV
ncbi:prephenate/arogenate dehydrogenase [Synechococcus sp. CCY9202]|uniref:prephenate/arogenate dehydrogenase n=1 Tax=Synechococcus sp. CCY9202 TaxID=174698 RepID=UPI002B1EE50D|nr:prephenate/arogenate dehydrogenase [Synechococcus sp. CCY9202]MEA5422453.1 prephenate/arogenate dehydrogenase [Synechococcus sp. CCY9202]